MKYLTTLFILVLCAGCGSKPKQLSYYHEPKIDSGAVYVVNADSLTIDNLWQIEAMHAKFVKQGWPVQPILIPLTNHSKIK